jgi:curved DNA-binding protein CbpA
MGDLSTLREALSLLGEVHREKRTGLLSLATQGDDLRVAVRDGQVQGISPPPGTPSAAEDPFSDPDDSARRRLEQVLVEVGLRRPQDSPRASGPTAGELRERLVAGLALGGTRAGFDDTADLPPDALPVTGGTEPLILEAVRRIDDAEVIRGLLGDLDRGLTAAPGQAHERTLTLTEGALLSRVDGVGTARQVLGSAPLEADDAQRGLAGLLLTGRVRYEQRPAPAEDEAPEPSRVAAASPRQGAEEPEPEAEPEAEAVSEPVAPMSPQLLAEKKEILRLVESLPFLSHFEVLGLEPGCTDGEARRAYVEQVKRYHPDAQREPALRDLHDAYEAIFIRVSEAWETLSDKESRAAYASRLGAPPEDPGDGDAPSSASPGEEEAEGDETLRRAQRLLKESRFWDAIQILEATVPRLEPESRQHRGQLLLARAYAQNPKWVRRAEKALQRVVREDPGNAEAHYELGVLYKSGGLSARAQAMFRKAVELRPGYPEAKAEMIAGDTPPSGGFLRRLFGGGGTGA